MISMQHACMKKHGMRTCLLLLADANGGDPVQRSLQPRLRKCISSCGNRSMLWYELGCLGPQDRLGLPSLISRHYHCSSCQLPALREVRIKSQDCTRTFCNPNIIFFSCLALMIWFVTAGTQAPGAQYCVTNTMRNGVDSTRQRLQIQSFYIVFLLLVSDGDRMSNSRWCYAASPAGALI